MFHGVSRHDITSKSSTQSFVCSAATRKSRDALAGSGAQRGSITSRHITGGMIRRAAGAGRTCAVASAPGGAGGARAPGRRVLWDAGGASERTREGGPRRPRPRPSWNHRTHRQPTSMIAPPSRRDPSPINQTSLPIRQTSLRARPTPRRRSHTSSAPSSVSSLTSDLSPFEHNAPPPHPGSSPPNTSSAPAMHRLDAKREQIHNEKIRIRIK